MLLGLILYSIAFLVTMLLFLKILKTYFENRLKVLLFYVFVTCFMAIVTLAITLDVIYEIELFVGPLEIEPIDFIMTIAIIAALLSWYFAITLSHKPIPPRRSYVIVFISGMILMGELLEKSPIFLINTVLEVTAIVMMAVETVNYIYNTYKEIIDPEDKKYLKFYIVGFITLLGSSLIPILGDIPVKYFNFPLEIFELGWAIVYSISLILMFYTVSKKPLVFILSRAYPTMFALMNSMGTPYFIQEFKAPKNVENALKTDVYDLYSSARELVRSGEKTGTIDRGKKKVLVEIHEDIIGMMVVNVETRYLRELLQKATLLFWERYHEILSEWKGEMGRFKDFKRDITQIFLIFRPVDKTTRKITVNAKKLDPLNKEDRILALLTDHTSSENACPYYSKEVPSKCLLDPTSRRAWDCEGKPFIKGFVCQYLLDHIEKKKLKISKT